MWFMLLFSCAKLTVNDVTSGESDAYPELRSIHEAIPRSRAWSRAEAAARSLWRDCRDTEPFHLECRDDAVFGEATVTVWVESSGPRVSRVMVRSRSPGRLGDFGAGRERILAFQKAFYAGPKTE